MNSHTAGIVSGLIATVVLSILMLLKAGMGLMPDVNAIKMLTGIAHNLAGTPQTPLVGWLLHAIIGVVLWGLLFAALYDRLPTSSGWSKGIVFSIGAWLLMMLIPMPMAGAGLFGLAIGVPAPIATLVLHIIFGAVLGASYQKLSGGTADRDESPAVTPH